jgi:hypothetical protein
MKYLKVYQLDQSITFGKYSYKTMREIADSDPNWLKWAINNSVIKVTDEVKDYLNEKENNTRVTL